MMANYLTFPMKTLRITQSYNGTYSHKHHTYGKPVDFPIDVGGADGGRDWVYCPCDAMKIVRIYGVGNSGANTVWLTSTTPVKFANGRTDYATMLCIHPNDDDLRKLHTGQIFKRGQAMFREGTNGRATGNHIHMSVGIGTKIGNGWLRNTNGAWTLTTSGGPLKPENAFYVDRSFTKVSATKGLKFIDKPNRADNPYKSPNYVCNANHHRYGKIYKGDEGVKWVQFELKEMGYYSDKIDGFFGPLTVEATKKFQTYAKSKGIYHDKIDGSAGPLTVSAIKAVR